MYFGINLKTTREIIEQCPCYHQSRNFWKKQFIKGYMAFVKLSAHVMSSLEDNLTTLCGISGPLQGI